MTRERELAGCAGVVSEESVVDMKELAIGYTQEAGEPLQDSRETGIIVLAAVVVAANARMLAQVECCATS